MFTYSLFTTCQTINIGVNPHKELFDISLPQSTFQFNQVTYLVLMVFCQTQIPVCLVFLAGL